MKLKQLSKLTKIDKLCRRSTREIELFLKEILRLVNMLKAWEVMKDINLSSTSKWVKASPTLSLANLIVTQNFFLQTMKMMFVLSNLQSILQLPITGNLLIDQV